MYFCGKTQLEVKHVRLCGGERMLHFQQHRPVSRENVERRRLVAHVVHLFDGIGHAALGHHLLVLSGGALESFPHVDVLQGN